MIFEFKATCPICGYINIFGTYESYLFMQDYECNGCHSILHISGIAEFKVRSIDVKR